MKFVFWREEWWLNQCHNHGEWRYGSKGGLQGLWSWVFWARRRTEGSDVLRTWCSSVGEGGVIQLDPSQVVDNSTVNVTAIWFYQKSHAKAMTFISYSVGEENKGVINLSLQRTWVRRCHPLNNGTYTDYNSFLTKGGWFYTNSSLGNPLWDPVYG